jgi:hypothetical protein
MEYHVRYDLLTNELIVSNKWDPLTLCATIQSQIPLQAILPNDVPFGVTRELIIDVPMDSHGKIDVYIDDTTGLTIDVPGTNNASRMEAVIPLAIKVAAHLNDLNEPIPCKPIVAKDKLTEEGGLSEMKMILGWLFNFWTLTIFLPDHKSLLGRTQSRA